MKYGSSCMAAGLMALTLTTGVPEGPARAQEITAETVAKRIDIAGRQRMLLERMAKFFCFARSGVDAISMAQNMAAAQDLYARSHRGFAYGDAEIGLFEEADGSVKQVWEDIDLLWGSLSGIYDDALSGELVTEEDFDRAMRLTLEVRKRNNDMVAAIRSRYADALGEGSLGEGILVDLYGRQRMLSQKLAKEVCLLNRGYRMEQLGPEVAETMELFETSLRAFREGLPIAGIPPAPSPEIADGLDIAAATWTEVRDVAASVVSGRAVSLSDLGTFAEGMDKFLVEMNATVGILAAHVAKGSS